MTLIYTVIFLFADFGFNGLNMSALAVRKKLVTVGDSFCGKTSLLSSFACNKFPEDIVPEMFENYVLDMDV